MRFSLVLASAIGATVMLTVTACQSVGAEPVKGTVVEKEHKPERLGTKQKCGWKKGSGKTKWACTPSTTGYKAECYELDIRLKDGSVVEECNKAAFKVLDLDDPYDSSQDYSREDQ